jgi:O-antigen ligase
MIYKRSPLVQFAYLAAYISGAEVLWRMTQAGVFWEYGKYLAIAVLLLALFRHRTLKIPSLPAFFLLLLVPGALMTILSLNWTQTRDELSSYFSGPVALFVCAYFFSQVTFSKKRIETLLWVLIMPIVGVAMLAFNAAQTVTEWSANSNNLASGGFSANQVSNTLGLGLLAIWILLLYLKMKWVVRIAAVLLGLWFLVQALLTLSRGGVLTAIIPGILITIPILFDRKRRAQIIVLGAGVLIFAILIGPALDTLTNGALTQRYSETDKTALTGRDEIAQGDINAFLENPLFGVGVGLAVVYRSEIYGGNVAAHTEYTRMLAEHGLFGLAAIILLVVMFLRALRQNWRKPLARSMVISVCMWTFIYLTQAAMRTVAPSLVFAIGLANFATDSNPQAVVARQRVAMYGQRFSQR